MFNVNDILVVIIEGLANTIKGEELTVIGQNETELLVKDKNDNNFKVRKSGLGIQFMVSYAYEPDPDDDPTQNKLDYHFLDIDFNDKD